MGKIKYESTVTLGSVIQIIIILGSLISAWHKMDKVLVDHEARLKGLERSVYGYNHSTQPPVPDKQYEPVRKPGS